MNEEEIIGRCLAGDSEAFEGLILAYQKPVFSLAHRMTGNPEDAMDVAQESFLKAFRSLSTFRRGSPFRPWLLRITANTANDLMRRRAHVAWMPAGGGPEMEIPDLSAGPEEMAERTEERDSVRAALMSLSPEYRTVVELFHVQGLSLAEIVQITGLNLTIVKNRLFRARKMLRERLLQETAPAVRPAAGQAGGREVIA
ncbi:MAG: sigma-70 family RNA polymerase sigma factor [Firmicutes bacterium]|nr:sigma-70 family RNA polymerase sigma factor [Bacillota bacterium]